MLLNYKPPSWLKNPSGQSNGGTTNSEDVAADGSFMRSDRLDRQMEALKHSFTKEKVNPSFFDLRPDVAVPAYQPGYNDPAKIYGIDKRAINDQSVITDPSQRLLTMTDYFGSDEEDDSASISATSKDFPSFQQAMPLLA